MDTSETYIKMCDCEEVQDKAPCSRQFPRLCEEHNFIVDAEGMLLSEDGGYYYGTMGEPPFVWLPRQDQIQAMCEWATANSVVESYLLFVVHVGHPDDFTELLPYYCQITSWEQLWLAFFMKEKHNKIWNGNEWVNQSIG